MYFILLLKLGCMVSGYHLKSHITIAQLKLAKTGHAFRCTFSRISHPKPTPPSVLFCIDSFASASATLANTYMTICWLTLLCIPRPKTRYPPVSPARKVWNDSSLPEGEARRRRIMVDLYATANLARFLACVRVALKMRASFSRRLAVCEDWNGCHRESIRTGLSGRGRPC